MKSWSLEDILSLILFYKESPQQEVQGALKERSWSAIRSKACRLGIIRSKSARKTGPKPIPVEVRFLRHVRKTDSCWFWNGAQAGGRQKHQRYGVFRVGSNTDRTRKSVYAHRWSYSYFKGDIPKGMQINHRCDNPLCVNPEHLVLGTQHDNVLDMYRKGRAFGKQLCPPCRFSTNGYAP